MCCNLNIQGIDASVNYNYDAGDWGSFDAGVNLSAFTMFKQHLKGGATVQCAGLHRLQQHLRVRADPRAAPTSDGTSRMSAQTVFANYISGYRNWSGNTVDARTLAGRPAGGRRRISQVEHDLRPEPELHADAGRPVLAEPFPAASSLSISRMFDKAPIFYNGATG